MNRVVLSAVAACFGAAPPPPLTETLRQALHRHGLAAFCWSHLYRDVHLRQALLSNLRAHEARRKSLQEVLYALRDVSVIAWKGLDYAHRLYADPAERPMGDHDLLVAEKDFDHALRVLSDIGYRAALEQTGVAALSRHYAAQLQRGGHQLDLHRAVRQPMRARVDYAAIFARAESSSLFGQKVLWLHEQDRLLLHCYHQAAHEHAVPLIGFVDLELMLLRAPLTAEVLERARRFGILRPLLHSLHLRAELFNRAGTRPIHWAATSIEEVMNEERPGRALQLVRKALLFDSPSSLLRFLRYALPAALPRSYRS